MVRAGSGHSSRLRSKVESMTGSEEVSTAAGRPPKAKKRDGSGSPGQASTQAPQLLQPE